MADTSQEEVPPQTNGISDGLDEDERGKMRPADIDADVREMERRKRVEVIMNSKLFREELERIIETQLKDGSGTSSLMQQISDMMGVSKHAGNVFKNSNCVVPINDIRGIESMGYAKGEKILRCKLAAVYRLIDLYGWSQGASSIITARLNQDEEQFLVNPYGMLFHEITASSLIKAGMQGNVIDQGTTNFAVNITTFSLHAAIHAARPDLKCIIHVHTPSVTAVSALKCGILPISQESVVIGEVSTHTYVAGVYDPEEKDKIARNLGPNNKVLLLTNQGAVCCGETIEEAFFNARNTVLACESQLKLIPVGIDNLVLLSDETRKKLYDAAHKAPESSPRPDQPSILEGKVERKWRVGGVEFEALMRMLDNAGFRTGYIYRHPLVKGEPPKPRNDVEVPPAVSSLGYLLEEEELYKQGLWKKLEGGRKGSDRTRWLNSPNVYQKVEILETGTPDPKKITKWVADGSPTHSSTPVKIDSALQFVPRNTNPKEFKKIQQQIKDYRRADKISAGPQSHILEGVTWEEARKMQDATVTQTGDHVVLMGAASKGIIQRNYQHNATIYKSPYAKNPFDSVTDEELDEYKKVVEKKVKGEYDTDFSESDSAQVNKSFDANNIRSPTSVASETEEESRDEPQVLRIETKHAPKPSQPEVVLSDDVLDDEVFESAPIQQVVKGIKMVRVLKSVFSPTPRPTCYRTNSFAGLPKGSYAVPNPVHFHVARYTTTTKFMRPTIIRIHPHVYNSNLPPTNHHIKDNPAAPIVTINIGNTPTLSLDVSLKTLKDFIYPFAKVLNMMNLRANTSSQTTYINNQRRERISSQLSTSTANKLNKQHTPFDMKMGRSQTDAGSKDQSSLSSMEANIMKRLHEGLMDELKTLAEPSEELDVSSEGGVVTQEEPNLKRVFPVKIQQVGAAKTSSKREGECNQTFCLKSEDVNLNETYDLLPYSSSDDEFNRLEQAPFLPLDDSPAPERESSTPTKESSTSTKESSIAAKESATPTKETSTPTKETSTPTKETSTPTKESSTSTKESSIAAKKSSTSTKETSTPTKESSIAAKESSTLEKQSSKPERDSFPTHKKSLGKREDVVRRDALTKGATFKELDPESIIEKEGSFNEGGTLTEENSIGEGCILIEASENCEETLKEASDKNGNALKERFPENCLAKEESVVNVDGPLKPEGVSIVSVFENCDVATEETLKEASDNSGNALKERSPGDSLVKGENVLNVDGPLKPEGVSIGSVNLEENHPEKSSKNKALDVVILEEDIRASAVTERLIEQELLQVMGVLRELTSPTSPDDVEGARPMNVAQELEGDDCLSYHFSIGVGNVKTNHKTYKKLLPTQEDCGESDVDIKKVTVDREDALKECFSAEGDTSKDCLAKEWEKIIHEALEKELFPPENSVNVEDVTTTFILKGGVENEGLIDGERIPRGDVENEDVSGKGGAYLKEEEEQEKMCASSSDSFARDDYAEAETDEECRQLKNQMVQRGGVTFEGGPAQNGRERSQKEMGRIEGSLLKNDAVILPGIMADAMVPSDVPVGGALQCLKEDRTPTNTLEIEVNSPAGGALDFSMECLPPSEKDPSLEEEDCSFNAKEVCGEEVVLNEDSTHGPDAPFSNVTTEDATEFFSEATHSSALNWGSVGSSIKIDDSLDEGIISDCFSSRSTTMDRSSEHDPPNKNISNMVEVLYNHLLAQSYEIKELILFPEILLDGHVSKLFNKLQGLYGEYAVKPLSNEEKSVLRISIYLQVMDKLKRTCKTPSNKEENCSDDSRQIQLDKMFSVAEYASDLLDAFFSKLNDDPPLLEASIDPNNFKEFHQLLSQGDSVRCSTPQDKITSTPVDAPEITSFKTKSSAETYWFTINKSPATSPKEKEGHKVVNIDEIPLKPPSEWVDPFEPFKRLPTIPECRQVLFPSGDDDGSEEDASNTNFVADNQKGEAKNAENASKDLGKDLLAGGDGQNVPAYTTIVRPEVNVVVCSTVSFYRTNTINATSYIQTSNVQFTHSADNTSQDSFRMAVCDLDGGLQQVSKENVFEDGAREEKQDEDGGENTVNGDQSDAHMSTLSQSSKEDSSMKDRSVSEGSPKKDKKKKKGLRTPSFLKKKKEKKIREA